MTNISILSHSQFVGESSLTAPICSRGVLGRMIFGGKATSPAESDHLLGIAKSGALPFLLQSCSRDM